VVRLDSAAAARIRTWTWLPLFATLGPALWVLAYLFEAYPPDPLPPVFVLLVMIAGTGFVWPGTGKDHVQVADETWWRFLRRRPLGIGLSVSLAILASVTAILATGTGGSMPAFAAASLVAALAALGAARSYAVWPAILSALGAVTVIGLMALIMLDYVPLPATEGMTTLPMSFVREIAISL